MDNYGRGIIWWRNNKEYYSYYGDAFGATHNTGKVYWRQMQIICWKTKKETIQSALKELEYVSKRCNITSIDQLLSATKENPLDWNALESFTEPSSLQNDLSFAEQRKAIKIFTEAINDYANVY